MKINYTGNLRTEAIHLKSGGTIITDAPVDNMGKGEAFSPTDLLCASLGTCMLTTMDIAAQKNEFKMDFVSMEATKIMVSDPRRVAEVIINIDLSAGSYTDEQKEILEKAALNCPVANSIHPDLKQEVNFKY
ncbi:MAG: OsmC family protein [Bacteroidia bacterium]